MDMWKQHTIGEKIFLKLSLRMVIMKVKRINVFTLKGSEPMLHSAGQWWMIVCSS
jgi:hypothetical protein